QIQHGYAVVVRCRGALSLSHPAKPPIDGVDVCLGAGSEDWRANAGYGSQVWIRGGCLELSCEVERTFPVSEVEVRREQVEQRVVALDWVRHARVEDRLACSDRGFVVALLHIHSAQDQIKAGGTTVIADRPYEGLGEGVLPVAHDRRDRTRDHAEHRLGIAGLTVVMFGGLPIRARRRDRGLSMQRRDIVGAIHGAKPRFEEAAYQRVVSLMRSGRAGQPAEKG